MFFFTFFVGSFAFYLPPVSPASVSGSTSRQGQLRGLQYIGVGYDIIKGNPEGDNGMAGTDPGLHFTKKILQIDQYKTEDQVVTKRDSSEEATMDGSGNASESRYLMDGEPAQIAFEPRTSCQDKEQESIIKDTKSYQASLSNDVSVGGGFDALKILSFKFSGSSNFKTAAELTDKKHSVILEERHVCNLGRVRYKTSLAMANSWPVSDEFAASVCQLPADYDHKAYMKFIEDYGTHVVVRADIGTKKITKYINTLDEFVTSANIEAGAAVNVEGSDTTGTANAVVDVKALFKLSRDTSVFKNTSDKESLVIGSEDLPEPISIKVDSIDMFLKSDFWQTLERFISSGICKEGQGEDEVREKKMKILKKALDDYPAYIGGQLPKELLLKMPIIWPKGRYGLPMTRSGCPYVGKGYRWNEGWRFQDAADAHAFFREEKKPEHIAIDYDDKGNVKSSFCTKTQLNWTPRDQDDVYERPWSKGRYCIYKKSQDCPKGFGESSIFWKDQRGPIWKGNDRGGSLPEGEYTDKETKIFFCCRADGFSENDIFLPKGKPFCLFSLDQNQCQRVKGMKSSIEIASWDAHTGTKSEGALLPYGKVHRTRVELQYCYYEKTE